MQRLIATPHPKIGLVIGTYAALPYVHLHLESARRLGRGIPVLVIDDGSTQAGVSSIAFLKRFEFIEQFGFIRKLVLRRPIE